MWQKVWCLGGCVRFMVFWRIDIQTKWQHHRLCPTTWAIQLYVRLPRNIVLLSHYLSIKNLEVFIENQCKSNDFSVFLFCMQLKSMDANRYATKKTIAQGMLDIALLTANASQLKYILQVGERHEFYTLMLIMISVSIIMQVNKRIFFFI